MSSDNDTDSGAVSRPNSIDDWLSAFLAAAAFHTRLPVPEGRHWSLAAILPVMPVLGLGIGLVLGGVFALAQALGATPLLAAFLTLAASAWLTGALHEDGLADTADGFGAAGVDAERRLEIMRDSSIGTFGACALILSFAIRAAALAEFAAGTGLLVLVAAHALSRAALGWPMLRLAPARSDGLAASQGRPGEADTWLAVAIGAALAFLFLIGRAPWAAILAPIAALAVAVLCTEAMRRRIGGYSGDTLGATQQLVEIAVLTVCAFCMVAVRL